MFSDDLFTERSRDSFHPKSTWKKAIGDTILLIKINKKNQDKRAGWIGCRWINEWLRCMVSRSMLHWWLLRALEALSRTTFVHGFLSFISFDCSHLNIVIFFKYHYWCLRHIIVCLNLRICCEFKLHQHYNCIAVQRKK